MNWDDFFTQEEQQLYYQKLMAFLDKEYREHTVYPSREDLFTCFHLCPYEKVKVVVLGQDPYHQPMQAHGLSFSVQPGVRIPPSLRNIYKELQSDLGIVPPSHGCLIDWAKQGVLMMNAVMSVQAGKAGSHRGHGWETFSDHVIQYLNLHETPVVFVLWGNWAKEKGNLIDSKHHIITSAHPSPLSAYHGFFGSRPFSAVNCFLKEDGLEEIQWKLEETACLKG